MGNIINSRQEQLTALDLTGGNLNVKNQFSASGPSVFNGTGTFNKAVIHNDISTFNATGIFNKPVTFNDSINIPSNKINNIDLTSLSSTSDVSKLQTTVSSLVGPTGAIDTSSVKTSKLDINGDIVNTGTGPAYITANTGAGLVLKDGNATGANIKIYNGAVTFSGPMSGTSLDLTGGLKAGAMTGSSLNVKGEMTGSSLNVTGAMTGSSLNVTGAMTGASLNVGFGAINGGSVRTGAITSGPITGTSLSAGSGALSGGSLNVTGAMTGASLNVTGAITGTSLSAPSLNLTSSSGGNWSIKEEGTKGLCFFKGTTGFACISSDGNLIAY